MVDADQRRRGAFILAGSQNTLLAERTTETLAGRVAVLKLMPLTNRELLGRPEAPFPWDPGYRTPRGKLSTGLAFWEIFTRGYYPEPVSERGRDINLWHASYLQTYLERDVRMIRQVGDLTLFQSFLRLLAARSAQLVNFTDISR